MKKLKLYYLKYRLKLAIGITLTLAALHIIAIYVSLEVNILSNDECIWRATKSSKDSVQYIFESLKVNGVTWDAGIRNGDQLLEINNEKIYSDRQAQTILNKFKSGQYVDYTVKKPDGKVLSTKVEIKKLVLFGNIAQSLSAIIWILIGFIVLSAKPDGHPQKLFFALGVFIALSSLNTLLPTFSEIVEFINENTVISFIIYFLVLVGQSFLPFVLLYFIWTFLKPFKFTEFKWMKVAFVMMPSILMLIGLIFLTKSFSGNIDRPPRFYILEVVYQYLTYAVNIAVFVSLGVIYFKEKDRESRKPVVLILIAFIFGLVIRFYLGTIAPAISDTIFNSPEYYMPVILIVLVPLTIAYAILKYHLLDVSIVVKNTITYGAATISGAVIYFLTIYLMGQWIGRVIGTENQGIIAGIFFILFALVFQTTKDRFQELLTKKFYPEQFAYQKVLMQFSNDVPVVVGTDKILDHTSKTFVEALKINKFGILLRDYKRDILYLAREYGFSNPSCVIEKSNMMAVSNEKNLTMNYPVIEQHDFPAAFPEKSNSLIDEGIYTVIPMIVKSKVVGALLFGLKYSGSKFGGKDLELLTAAANQLAISLENARLYQSESEKIKIERDLDLARKIQQGLLPGCIPNVNKLDICGQMIPAMQVGGDYYDLIKISDSKIFVVVGDVSGKGLSASLYMTKLQTMIQLACTADRTPKQILVDINKKLYESLERSWFITMTLALFDSSTNTVKFCRAGHMPLITANNGSIISYKTQGIGVGLESGVIFESSLVEEEVSFTHGQIFAFFSDGITEAMNESNDLFGEEKLSELLKNKSAKSSNDIMEDIWQSLTQFRGRAEQNDDMTMVLVKVT